MISELYKLSLTGGKLTKLFLVFSEGTDSREESLEFHSYLHMLRNQHMRQETSSIGAQQSRLLTLPAELRNTIYRFVLINEDFVPVSQEVISHLTPLLQTCQQTKAEASGIFYAENTFTTTASVPGAATSQAAAWVHSLSTTDASAIKLLQVKWLLPRSSMRLLKAAKILWIRNDEFDSAYGLGRIMTEQDKNAANFLGSLDGMALDLKCVVGADSIGFADGKMHNHTPAHFRSILTESWRLAIRKRADRDLRQEIENATLEKPDGWTA